MKINLNTLIWAAITMSVTACSPNSPETTTVSVGKDDSAMQTTDHHHEEEGKSLTLNNGEKWKADSITNANVSVIIGSIKSNNPSSLDDYHKIAHMVQQGINKLLQDCKMQGPDHEALHHWLEPLLEKNEELAKSTSVEEAGKIFTEERDHLGIYQNYFQ